MAETIRELGERLGVSRSAAHRLRKLQGLASYLDKELGQRTSSAIDEGKTLEEILEDEPRLHSAWIASRDIKDFVRSVGRIVSYGPRCRPLLEKAIRQLQAVLKDPLMPEPPPEVLRENAKRKKAKQVKLRCIYGPRPESSSSAVN